MRSSHCMFRKGHPEANNQSKEARANTDGLEGAGEKARETRKARWQKSRVFRRSLCKLSLTYSERKDEEGAEASISVRRSRCNEGAKWTEKCRGRGTWRAERRKVPGPLRRAGRQNWRNESMTVIRIGALMETAGRKCTHGMQALAQKGR